MTTVNNPPVHFVNNLGLTRVVRPYKGKIEHSAVKGQDRPPLQRQNRTQYRKRAKMPAPTTGSSGDGALIRNAPAAHPKHTAEGRSGFLCGKETRLRAVKCEKILPSRKQKAKGREYLRILRGATQVQRAQALPFPALTGRSPAISAHCALYACSADVLRALRRRSLAAKRLPL